jgi:transcriptional regulator with XRE-family HTH domain
MGRDEFGPQLRLEREWRGITLEELAATTKVSVELWEAMERNDFSRWPSGVFARAFVRDYARAVGLDVNAVVNDFCRYFPQGDRRAARIVKGQADLIGHQLQANEAELLPAGRERRKADRRAPTRPAAAVMYGPRVAAAAVDVTCVSLVSLGLAGAFGAGFLGTLGVSAVVYFGVSTVALGTSPGMRLIEAIRLRVPTLFASRRTVSA